MNRKIIKKWFVFILFFLFDVNHDDVYICASVSDFIHSYECAPLVHWCSHSATSLILALHDSSFSLIFPHVAIIADFTPSKRVSFPILNLYSSACMGLSKTRGVHQRQAMGGLVLKSNEVLILDSRYEKVIC